jgi:hypothetical protein
MQLFTDYRDSSGSLAAANGWLRRARRLVDDHGLERYAGWVLLREASIAADPVEGEALADEALDHARRSDDVDLELCALSQIGVSLVEQGRVADGVGFLDEAMTGSLGSGGSRPGTAVFTCCNTLAACTSSARFERVVQLGGRTGS